VNIWHTYEPLKIRSSYLWGGCFLISSHNCWTCETYK